MPMTTFLNPVDYLQETSNSTINGTLCDLRTRTGRDWRVQEMIYTTGFFKKKTVKRYRLYVETISPEFQVINFARENDCSIYEEVPAETLLAYMIGYHGGVSRTMYRLFTEVHILKSLGVSPSHPLPRAIRYLNREGND